MQHQSSIFLDQPNIKAKLNGHKTTKIFYTMSYLQIQSLSSKGSITLFPAVSLSHRKKATSHHSNFLFMTKSKHKTKKKRDTPSRQPVIFSSTEDVVHIHHVIVTKPYGLGWSRQALLL